MSNSFNNVQSSIIHDIEEQIPKGYNLETNLRRIISEILEPTLRKTEDCTRTIELFSEVLDTSSKKFEHCLDIYEVLTEKSKIRFTEIDSLIQQTKTIESNQIINQGFNKQEMKELRQEIAELKDSLQNRMGLVEQLSKQNERLQEEMVKANNRIIEAKAEFQEQMSKMVKNYFQNFATVQSDFSKMQADFVITQKNLEQQRVVFAELQIMVDMHKIERSDLKNKIENLFFAQSTFALKSDFEEFQEQCEKQIDINQDEIFRMQKEMKESALSQSQIIQKLQISEQSMRNDIKGMASAENEIKKKLDMLSKDTKNQINDAGSQLRSHKNKIEVLELSASNQSNSTNELKQSLRKDYLRLEQKNQELQKQITLNIDEKIAQIEKKIKQSISETFQEELVHNEDRFSQQSNSPIKLERKFSKESQGEIQQNEVQIQQIVAAMLNGYISDAEFQKQFSKRIEDVKGESKLIIERDHLEIMNFVKSEIASIQISESSISQFQSEITKIGDIKLGIYQILDQFKEEHQNMSDKVDKVCNKVITMQSDSTLHHEFTQSQIKKLSKDKEKLEKASKNTSLLASILSESMMILTTAMITNEIDKREQYNLPPEQGNQVAPSRFFSIIDGLVFDLADQQQQKLHPCKMTYRQLIIDKSELLKTSLVSVVNAWDTIANQGVEDLIESSPGKIFKNQIQNKIKIENKKPTRPSSLGRSKPYAAENESQNWARYASSEIRTHSNSLSLGSNNASSNNPLPLKNITTINNQANPNSSLIGLSNTLNYLSLNQNSNNNNSNNNNNNNNNNSSSNNNNHISSNNYTNNSNIIGYQIPTDNNDSSDLIFNKLITNHSAQLADIDNIDGKKQLNKKKQNNSQKLSLSHRKILKTTQQFNQAHLISLSKTLTKPNTSTERQREKIQKNASEAHRVDITFCN